MVNGNYILYGDKPASDSEIVEDHVHGRTLERKRSRKVNRTANELQRTLNMAQLDNETDSVKFEKKVKEPKLLRYVPTTEIEENYVTEKFETHDLKPNEEQAPRRYAFTKKPKNPTDGSINYAYSRSSSNCSSPNLPTIVEHGEQYGTYRVRDISPTCDLYEGYENKMDKYFVKPRESTKLPKKVGYNGTHPDSLYRVNTGAGTEDGKFAKVVRLLRWPLALFVVCVALAMFVYFLVPSSGDSVPMNGTYWEMSLARAQIGPTLEAKTDKAKHKPPERNDLRSSTSSHGTKTTEIDFYDADSDRNVDIHSLLDKLKTINANKKPPIAPVFPTHIAPEVQYGDSDKTRTPKLIEETNTVLPLDSTLKPKLHITQKPEKPLAVYFKEGDVSTSTEISTDTQATNDFVRHKDGTGKANEKNRPPVYIYGQDEKVIGAEPRYENDYRHLVANVNFTSGHSKLFGISIEDAEHIKSTTQSALYHTKVSPTLPMWRDGDDATTKRYPVNYAPDIQPQCRSTQLPLCRGVLQYDLTTMATAFPSGIDIHSLLPDIEYVVASNCSERVKHFVCALLEPECSPTPSHLKRPCLNLCKAVVDYCEELITPSLLPVFNCSQYQSRNCMAASGPCFDRELQCGDGSCVPRDWMCDGSVDCPGGEDEATCARCTRYEFQCQSGMCLQNAWVCDGYADCPDGDDESSEACSRIGAQASRQPELGEELSGSAPAPSVRRPNRLPGHRKAANSPAEESSKELLMTSDSNNALRRNYTRRPSPSRLTPYARTPVRQPKPTEDSEDKRPMRRFNPDSEVNRERALERPEDAPGELNFFDEFEPIQGQLQNRNKDGRSSVSPSGFEPTALDGTPSPEPENQRATHLDKKKSKLQRLLDGAALMRKVQKQIDEQTPPPMEGEENMKMNSTEDALEAHSVAPPGSPGSQGWPGSPSAHVSPCPSGELRCVDGRCITLAQLCDGNVDCSDHADEDNCFT